MTLVAVAATYDNFLTAVFLDMTKVAIFIFVTVMWNMCGAAFMNIWLFRGIEMGVIGGGMFWFLRKRPKKFSLGYYLLLLILMPCLEMSVVSRACQYLKIEHEIFRSLAVALIIYALNYFYLFKLPLDYTFKKVLALNIVTILALKGLFYLFGMDDLLWLIITTTWNIACASHIVYWTCKIQEGGQKETEQFGIESVYDMHYFTFITWLADNKDAQTDDATAQ